MTAETIRAKDDTITFACPKCQLHTQETLEKAGHAYQCRVKCPCGNIFTATIELRERSRRQLDLAGEYQLVSRQGVERWVDVSTPGACRVIDLSRKGLAFLKNDDQQLNPGELIKVNFRLDDTEGTEIIQECEVRHVKVNFVGGLISKLNPELEYYLLG
ncbi:MAG: PilZ domain-containing protein [Desulfobulbaceae bacterium]|nr:PilZ domain-containing protein [Desulfobulbaceae bacterium]